MIEYNGHFEMIDPRLIVVDHRYQRPEKHNLIGAIAAAFRWELFGVPVLFKRGNIYYCGDGQQRIAGALRSPQPPKLIPCVWFELSHLRDEAAVFVQIQDFRIALSAMEKHKSRIVAENPATLALERVAQKVGFTIGAASRDDENTVTAIATLYWVYDEIAEEGLTQTMTVCRDAFEDDSGKFSAPIIRVVAKVIQEQGELYERAKLTAALKKTTPGKIIRKAEEFKYEMGGSMGVNVRRAVNKLTGV